MISRSHLYPILLAALVVSACGKPLPVPPSFSDADRQANRQIVDSYTKSLLAADSKAVAALYAEDATLFPPNQPAVRGRAEIEKFTAAFPKVTAFSAVDEEIEGSGDIAYASGKFRMTFLPPGAKAAVTDSGKFVEVRRKQPDGSWLIQRLIFNSDIPAGK
jgi:uncharacterized protein (TIGR02246 family)